MRNKRKRGVRSGVATIEMAMVAPVIFLMIFGSVEFARMMMVRQSFTNASREGCRHACLVTTTNTSNSEEVIRAALKGVIEKSMSTENLTITFSPSFDGTAPSAGTPITASIEIDCAEASWLPPFFTSGARIKSYCKMYRE